VPDQKVFKKEVLLPQDISKAAAYTDALMSVIPSTISLENE
jgi:hypothetical protein